MAKTGTEDVARLREDAVKQCEQQLGEVVLTRKRKLAELYYVASLSRIKESNTNVLSDIRAGFGDYIEGNMLEKGLRFDIKTLKLNNYGGGVSAVPSGQGSVPAGAGSAGEPGVAAREAQGAESPAQDVKIGSQQLNSSQAQSAQQAEGHAPAQDQAQPQGQAHAHSQQDDQAHTPTINSSPVNDRTSSAGGSATSAAVVPRHRDLKKRKVQRQHQASLFNPENKEAQETLVLLLKENLPSKIPEATSLAELYYLAQPLPLVKLMPTTHKVVTSTMFEAALTEGKINVVHSRIEELKKQGKWGLRQPKKFVDPFRARQRTHWDNLLSEMNWMAVDYREERKLRVATCACIAQSVLDYFKYGKVCCVKRKEIVHIEPEEPTVQLEEVMDLDGLAEDAEEPQDAMDISKLLQRPDAAAEIGARELPQVSAEEYEQHVSPFKLSLSMDELNDRDKTLIESLPAFQSFSKFGDEFERLPLVPISKSLLPVEDEDWYNVYLKQNVDETPVQPPNQKGLFGSNQRRLNTVKPPSPPSLKYLDLRTPTIWLPEDDQRLIDYVGEFSFNWGIVSAHLSKRPTRSYSSNIERRTPWQCFERYIQLNDTFQIQDMRGHNTLNAMKWLEHAHHIQTTTKRRISPLGVGVDSIQRGHKRLRWASMFDAIRKCMRKRESVTRPNNSQLRKNIDDKKLAAPTPAELLKLKYEREKSIQEMHLQNSHARQRIAPNVGSAGTGGATGGATGSAGASGNAQAAAQQQQQRPVAQQQSQGSTPVMGNASLPQQNPQHRLQPSAGRPSSVPVQQVNANQARSNSNTMVGTPTGSKMGNLSQYTPEQVQQIMQLRQRQQLQQQQQQQQQHLQNKSFNGIQSAPNSSMSSPVMNQSQNPMSPMNSTASVNGRMNNSVSAQITAIINKIQAQNPNMSKQEVTKIAAQYLSSLQAKQNRNAMGTGMAGGTGSPAMVPVSPANNQVMMNGPNLQRSNSNPNLPHPHQQKKLVPQPQMPQQTSPQQMPVSMAGNLTPQQKAQLEMLQAMQHDRQIKPNPGKPAQ